METLKLWARNGEPLSVRLWLANWSLETASEELTDEFLLFAIRSGRSPKWLSVPDPRQGPEIGMEVIVPHPWRAPLPGLYSMAQIGTCCVPPWCWGLGYSVEC